MMKIEKGWPAFVSSILCFGFGIALGVFYMNQIMETRISAEKLNTARIRFQDWKKFSDHVADDRRRGGNYFSRFPSDVSLSNPVRVPKAESGPRIEAAVLNTRTLKRGDVYSDYAAQVTFTNRGYNHLVLYVPDISVEDTNGKRYAAKESIPPFPVFGIPGGYAETYLISYTLPNQSVPSRLIVEGTSKFFAPFTR